ncbi:sugar ABC transporter substrate-binding protein [Oenococcus sicerae]|uniref:Sugar ABC transporter substrate-binding protein n=1 Tax=Oenococcus sicerae TaxID=2203724 RepID=A0ABX5QLX1_9LACO|nr:sugar ABC transporter substrate-binding protein [Oenococcus sicerae]QAS69797.1 sugar ABC transporter substrate-binding protein [Oenococcus sicerae]
MRKGKIAVIAVVVLAAVFVVYMVSGSGNSGGNTKKNITMWVHYSKDDPEGKAMVKNIALFNKTNGKGYHATVQYIPRSSSGGGYEDKINAALNSNSLPDVMTLDGPNTAAYAKSKIIQPVGKYIKNKQDILPSILSQGTYKNKLYAVGYSESGVGIYYNKKMFKEAGISDSELPSLSKSWNWDQFTEIAKKLKDHFNRPAIDLQLNDHSEWSLYSFAPFIWSAGGKITNAAGTKAEGVFDSKQTQTAFTFLQNLVKNGYTTISPIQEGFQTGKYPMLMSGSWAIQELNTSYKNIDYGILPYPVSPKTGKLVSPTGSWQYAMSASTSKPEAAGALVNFLTETAQMYRTAMTNTVLPARKSVSKKMLTKVSAPMEFLIQQNLKSGHSRPVLVNYPQVSRIFADAVTKTTYYKQNPNIADLLESEAKTIQSYLK